MQKAGYQISIAVRSVLCLFYVIFISFFSSSAWGGIHSAPVILTAQLIRPVQYHPLAMYRVFRTLPDGTAKAIPFQIDEKDRYGDYILDEGAYPNTKLSNGIFDFRDELTIMGNDIGIIKTPTKWPFQEPSVLYEVIFKDKEAVPQGAIYIGAYFSKPPPLDETRYIQFLSKQAEIVTSRYRYRFDHNNYLVVRGIDLYKMNHQPYPLIDSSTLFMRADLKYFLTLDVNQQDIASELEAYKRGPIRCIARVNFNYNILKLNFDLGMYTEVSFFPNSVVLPALIDNPLDGQKILNRGSLFYYGFAFKDNPWTLKIDTNMPEYQEKKITDFLKKEKKYESKYWFSAISRDYMIYVEMEPSVQMLNTGNIPLFYRRNIPAAELAQASDEEDRLPGSGLVNLAMAMDLTSFNEGLHNVAIQIFIENRYNENILQSYKDLGLWTSSARRLSSSTFRQGNAPESSEKSKSEEK